MRLFVREMARMNDRGKKYGELSMETDSLRRGLRGEDGQDLIEWALLAAFIAIVIVVLLFSFRDPLLGLYQNILDHLDFANGHLPV